MSKAKKPDNKELDEDDLKPAPWACEIEFYNRPSYMSSIFTLDLSSDEIRIVTDNNSVVVFPYDSVRKVLIMHTTSIHLD